MKFNSLYFLLLAAGDSFSPPQARSRQTCKTTFRTTTPQTQSAQSQEAETETQQWYTKIEFQAKKTRPLSHLSLEELKALTLSYLDVQSDASDENTDEVVCNNKKNENSSSHQLNELKKLISAWSKLASAGYISSKRSDEAESDAIILTKTDMRMAAEMAEMCLKHLVEKEKEGEFTSDIVSVDLYHSVITAWVKAGSHSDLIHTASLLDYMENNGHNKIVLNRHNSSDTASSKSSVKCYVAVLDGWCKSPYKDAANQAEEVLRRMVTLGIHSVKHYNNVLNRLATSGKSNSGIEAERLLNELIDMFKSGSAHIAPDRSSFNTVIKAYANPGIKNGSRNAKRILSMMENPSKYGLEKIASEIEPDKVSCTSIMMAWANGNEHGTCDVDAGEKAEQLLRRMEKVYESKGDLRMRPDTATYNAVIKVWGKCGHPLAAQKSEELLNKMLAQYDEEGKNADIMPGDITFNSVIHNIANSVDMDAPQRAQRLLEKMQYCYERGRIDYRPDIITYNSVLNALAKSNRPGSAQQAEDMLNNLEKAYDSGAWDIQPDVYSYNTVISAWSNCNEENSAQRAVALLDRMSARVKEKKSKVKPDLTTYNTVLHAWSQSSERNAPIKALGLLELMFRLYDNGNEDAKPDVLSFSTVINAFSKSNFSGKAQECRNLLRRMQRLYDDGHESMKPNIFVYSSVLNACAYTFGRPDEKEEALNIGIQTWKELMDSDIQPNHVAYGSYLKICRRLMAHSDIRRTQFLTRTFQQCCTDGQVGHYVLKQIKADYTLSTSLLQAYIVDDEVQCDDLPAEWTQNVRERRRTTRPRVKSGVS